MTCAQGGAADAGLEDPVEVLRHLRSGDTLIHCLRTGWRLMRADAPVSAEAVRVLQRGPGWIFGKRQGRRQGRGQLRPMGDGLPGFGVAQTWQWVDGATLAAAAAAASAARRQLSLFEGAPP